MEEKKVEEKASDVLKTDVKEEKEKIVLLSDKSGEFIKSELMKLELSDIRKEYTKSKKYYEIAEAIYRIKRNID